METLANGNEVRTHTRYAVNPVTGETEVIPFIDTATGRVLETEFGMLNHLRPMTQNRGRNVTETASELVGLHALKLMDEAPAQFTVDLALCRYEGRRSEDRSHDGGTRWHIR